MRHEYTDSRIFVGMSVIMQDGNDQALLQGPGVKAVYPIRQYTIPALEPTVVSESFVRGATGHAKGSVGAKAAAQANDTFEPHVMTGVDKLHAEGLFGEGQIVGILDTGVDYHHPALGNGFGPGFPVSGGYDLVGDDYTGSNSPMPDPDPYSGCAGHGTHVTGTVIANDTELGFTGVVPHANVYMYRVFGCNGSTGDDVIIAAMERGFFDGVDILSLSLGGPGGWVESPSAAVASRISDLGTPVVMAAGNDGSFGMFYGSSPGVAKDATSVGAVNNRVLTGYTAVPKPSYNHSAITYLVGTPFKFNGSASLPVYATSKDPNVTADACDPLPDSTPDLGDKVVVVARGTCTFATKFQNIYAKGGKTVLVYNTPAPAQITYVDTTIVGQQVASLTRADGQWLVEHFAAGDKLSLDFSDTTVSTTPNTMAGGLMADFSTYAPEYELHQSPHVSAPGGNILSTWPLDLGKYAIISGTSMATPFVSGSYALYRSAKGTKKSATELRSIFAATGSPVAQTKDKGALLETLAKQGGGLIQVYDAVHAPASVSPGALLLNDTEFFKAKHTITVSNEGVGPRIWKIVHEPVGTAISIESNSTFFNTYPVPLEDKYAAAHFSQSILAVPGGQKAKFTVTFSPPKGLNAAKLPYYSGYIHLVPLDFSKDSKDDFRIAYFGVASRMKDTPILDDTDGLFGFKLPALLTPDQTEPITSDNETYSLKDNSSQPNVLFRLQMGSPLYSLDLVDADIAFKPTIPLENSTTKAGKRSVDVSEEQRMARARPRAQTHFDAHARTHSEIHNKRAQVPLHVDSSSKAKPAPSPASDGNDTFSSVPTIGNLDLEHYLGRNSADGLAADYSYNIYTLNGTFFNGTDIPDGRYRILLRAQKIFTHGKSEDYESWLSHAFSVKRKNK